MGVSYMQLLRFADLRDSINQLPNVIAIGNFDGMHLGHQHVINYARKIAYMQNSKTCIVIFEPQPKEFFLKKNAPLRITPFRDKIQALKALNIDYVLCLQFTQKLANFTPEEFVKKILINGLNAKNIVIGDDFHFGHNRQGNTKVLKNLGDKYSFNVTVLSPYTLTMIRVSSSYIRKLLLTGKFFEAKRFLGHSYTLSGRIHHGKKNGQKIGYPTINISIPTIVVLSGVYIVRVHFKNKIYYGISNIGIRPTIGKNEKRLLETHILNFKKELYGEYITIEFLNFVRNERKFENFEALKKQIDKDKKSALTWIKNQTTRLEN